jgi:ABC-2 type transport system permease protein
MSKIGIIIQREYLSRVTKRTFILTTLGLPILIILFYAVMGFIIASDNNKLNIAVVDESKVYENQLQDQSKNKKFEYFGKEALDTLYNTYDKNNYDLLLHIKPFNPDVKVPDSNTIIVHTQDNVSLDASNYVNDRLDEVYKQHVLLAAGFNTSAIDSIRNISVKFKTISAKNVNTNSAVAFGIGQACGALIYVVILIYGTMVMRGVMEEKTNRIAEVIVSSVKPFELMMGKIVGIALVGLTQFAIWGIFIVIISSLAAFILPTILDADTLSQIQQSQNATPNLNMPITKGAISASNIQDMMGLSGINFKLIGACFILYFIGGYFLYSSMFAAVGSLVNEDVQEAQGLTLPVTMPIIIAFLIGIQASKEPNSTLALFGSIFPLTSPIVMMSRMAYNPPIWQIILSLTILIIAFIGFTWLAAKIYRTGILMYGKKGSWKEVWKWIKN